MIENLIAYAKQLLDRLEPSPLFLTMVVWTASFLLLLSILCGCAPHRVRPNLPPQADPRPVPNFQGKTYRDVLLYVVELREACQASEADKAAIRDVFRHD